MKYLPLAGSLAAILMVAACAPNHAQLEAERRQMEYEQDYNACISYGTVANSPAFNECMREMDMKRQAQYGYTKPYYSEYEPYPPPRPREPYYHDHHPASGGYHH